jgi:site-specific DNA recombinase
VPSLLQGLAACASCGYGYYRTSTTTSSGKKIYYYRCLGSDDYRYQGGRVCANKPVRADYVDQVIWDHVTGLLADPALIRTEIDRRLERARTSDPVTKKHGQLEQALAKTSASIAAMVTAFSEQLITIDELRARMPDLRARETGLKDQIAALDAYLKLADDLQGFLAKLRANSATVTTEDRQRVPARRRPGHLHRIRQTHQSTTLRPWQESPAGRQGSVGTGCFARDSRSKEACCPGLPAWLAGCFPVTSP